jgi:hypothetical protein
MHKSGDGVGSLILGLYADDGQLWHVGVAASFTAKRRAKLLDEVAPLRMDNLDGPPLGEWSGRRGQRRRVDAGRPEPLERGGGARPLLDSAAPRTGGRGLLHVGDRRPVPRVPRRCCAGGPTASRPRARPTSWPSPRRCRSKRSSPPTLGVLRRLVAAAPDGATTRRRGSPTSRATTACVAGGDGCEQGHVPLDALEQCDSVALAKAGVEASKHPRSSRVRGPSGRRHFCARLPTMWGRR